jgi:hypothetical protein
VRVTRIGRDTWNETLGAASLESALRGCYLRALRGLLLCVVFALAWASAAYAAAPQTLVRAPTRIDAFAQDGHHIAWLTGGCARLAIRSLRTGLEVESSSRAATSTCPHNTTHLLALSGGRALWARAPGGITVNTLVYTFAAGDRRRRVARLDWSPPGNGRLLTGMEGDRGTLVFAWVEVEHLDEGAEGCFDNPVPCQLGVVEGRVLRVSRTQTTRIPGAPAPAFLAVSKGRVALAQVAPQYPTPGPVARGPVEVRDAATGSVITTVEPSGSVRTIAVSGGLLATFIRQAGTTRIDVWDAFTSGLLRSVILPDRAAADIDLAGERLVWRAGRSIYVLDLMVGTSKFLFRSRLVPVGLSIEGRRVAWAAGRTVRAIKLPPQPA